MTDQVGQSLRLRDRDVAVLRALENEPEPLAAGRVWHLACPDEPYRGRRDAGMTRTLDRLERMGFVRGRYEWESTCRYWSITEAGITALIGIKIRAEAQQERDPSERVRCDRCAGQGEIDDPDELYTVITCPACGGSGRVLLSKQGYNPDGPPTSRVEFAEKRRLARASEKRSLERRLADLQHARRWSAARLVGVTVALATVWAFVILAFVV